MSLPESQGLQINSGGFSFSPWTFLEARGMIHRVVGLANLLDEPRLRPPAGTQINFASAKETPMHSRLAACVVFIAGCVLLAIPARPAAQANQAHPAIVAFAPEPTSRTLSLVSFKGSGSAASCTLQGRPCNPQHSPCCPGLKCVFRGGSTRVGYQCTFGTASANASTSSLQERWSGSKLDQDDL